MITVLVVINWGPHVGWKFVWTCSPLQPMPYDEDNRQPCFCEALTPNVVLHGHLFIAGRPQVQWMNTINDGCTPFGPKALVLCMLAQWHNWIKGGINGMEPSLINVINYTCAVPCYPKWRRLLWNVHCLRKWITHEHHDNRTINRVNMPIFGPFCKTGLPCKWNWKHLESNGQVSSLALLTRMLPCAVETDKQPFFLSSNKLEITTTF